MIQEGAEAQQRRERERRKTQWEGQAFQQVSIMLLAWCSQVYRCVDTERVSRDRKRREKADSHGGPVVKNLPSNAGHEGLMPGRGTKIPPVVGQLSLSHSY